MGKTFRKLHISLAGDFGHISEKIKQWVEANGGDFSKHLEKGATTHLITTKDAIRKRDATVQQARKIKDLKIVKLEWLEDSLLSRNRRPKREKDYLWYQARGTRKPDTTKHKDATKKLDGVVSNGLKKQRRNHGPGNEVAFVKYTRVGRAGSAFLAPTGSTWEIAFGAFTKFFKAKCGGKWEERMDGTEPLPRKAGEGCVLPPSENWFRFEPQTGVPAGTGKSSSSTALAEQGKSKEAES